MPVRALIDSRVMLVLVALNCTKPHHASYVKHTSPIIAVSAFETAWFDGDIFPPFKHSVRAGFCLFRGEDIIRKFRLSQVVPNLIRFVLLSTGSRGC